MTKPSNTWHKSIIMGRGVDDSLGAGITQKEFSEKVGHDVDLTTMVFKMFLIKIHNNK